MTTHRFDALTKTLATRLSRRSAMQATGLGLATSVIGMQRLPALAQDASPAASPAAECTTGSREDNLAIATRWFNDGLNQGNLDVVDEIVASNVTIDAAVYPSGKGPKAIKDIFTSLLTAYPDVHISIDQSLVDDDYVVVQWTGTGTQKTEFLGVSPADGLRTWSGIHVFHLSCGKIVEVWAEVDGLTQVGLTTPADNALTASPEATPGFVIGECQTGSREENTAIAERWSDIWNSKDVSLYEDIVHPDAIHHFGVSRDVKGIPALQEGAEQFFTAFPDLTATTQKIIVDGDFVALRFTDTGTQSGTFLGVEPTGKRVSWTGLVIFRIQCGRVRESWSEVSNIDIWRQIGKLAPAATPVP